MRHTPVLVTEILELFQPQPGDRLLDATLGGGGHAEEYLERTAPDGAVVGLDADPQALKQARQHLARFKNRVTYINANFANLNDALHGGGIVTKKDSTLPPSPPASASSLKQDDVGPVQRSPQGEVGFNYILFDLGIGTHQLSNPDRGFSFKHDAPLTMRYGTHPLPPAQIDALNHLTDYLGHEPDANEIIQHLATSDLANVIRQYSEERYAKRIATASKRVAPLTAHRLAEAIAAAVPAPYARGRIHPATRTFQALRLAVNRELESLDHALPQAYRLLAAPGQMAIISFHSLEDRLVKNFFRKCAKLSPNTLIITPKPISPSDDEVKRNPRARSAKLRALEKK